MPTLADFKAPYPAPTSDQKRYVIYLEQKGDDEDSRFQLELIPGRMEDVDGANRHFIGGNIEEKTVDGWGYNYYVVQLFATAGTLMMPLGTAAKKTKKFVRMHPGDLVRYNSKLPVVVYVPKNAELKYKVWTARGDDDASVAVEE